MRLLLFFFAIAKWLVGSYLGFDQGSDLPPWQWKCRVLTTGPSRNSWDYYFEMIDLSILKKWLKYLYQTTLPASWEICMQVKKQQLELCMGQQTGSKLRKAVYCYPTYLTYMQSISCKMLGWMKHKLESKLPGEIPITSDVQLIPPLWQKAKKN